MSAWKPIGGYGDNGGVLHVKASGQGNLRSYATARGLHFDRVKTPLKLDPVENERYRIQAKVRWLAGFPAMRISLGWFWMEAPVQLSVPTDLGTPGNVNSRRIFNTPPVVEELRHEPLLPAAGESVLVTCRIHDPEGISTAVLEYRNTAHTGYRSAPLRDDGVPPDRTAGDGLYSARLPGYPESTIAGFRVRAVDGAAQPAESHYPSPDSAQNALVRYGDPVPYGVLGDFYVWVSPENEATWLSWNTRGNGTVDATLVFNGWRVFYNCEIRWRGNGRSFKYIKRGAYSVQLRREEPYLDDIELKIDIPNRSCGIGTYQQEHQAYWLCREAGGASSQVRFIRLYVNGSKLLRQDFETPSRAFCRYWYNDPDPHVFEHRAEEPLERHTKTPTGAWNMAKVRHGLQKKRTDVPDMDYRSMILIAEALLHPDIATAEARLKALIDPYGMAAYFATNRVVGNNDSYGIGNKHNGVIYGSPSKRLRWHMIDLDCSYKKIKYKGFYPNGFPGKIFEIPHFRREYLQFLKSLHDSSLDPLRCDPVLQGWHRVLRDEWKEYRAKAPKKMITWNAKQRAKIAIELDNNAAAFAITTLDGEDFSTSDRILTLEGTAPIDVYRFLLNGFPLRVDFPTTTTWTTSLGLAEGFNRLVLEGYDRQGTLVASDEITVNFTGSSVLPLGQVLITEIMYNAESPKADFVELYNRSATESFDLSNWRLEGLDLTFEMGTILGPGAYAVVVSDTQIYAHAYTNSEAVIGEFDGSLDNDGQALRLLKSKADGGWTLVDEVHYKDKLPWPIEADGLGTSLQLKDVNHDNGRIGNWAMAGPGAAPATPGASNSVATSLSAFPPLWINEVLLRNEAFDQDNAGEFEPWIELYNAGDSMLRLDDYFLSNDPAVPLKWAFPPGLVLPAGGFLRIWADGETNETTGSELHAGFHLNAADETFVLATEQGGQAVVLDTLTSAAVLPDHSFGSDPNGEPFRRHVFAQPTPGAANRADPALITVRINEWMADNETTLTDPADNDFEDWFELYNYGENPVDLSGCFLSDKLTNKTKYVIPKGTVIEANRMLLFWADGEMGQTVSGGDLHVDFKLSNRGEILVLYAPNGTPVDIVTFGSQKADISSGRYTDGMATIGQLAQPTPGSPNSETLLYRP